MSIFVKRFVSALFLLTIFIFSFFLFDGNLFVFLATFLTFLSLYEMSNILGLKKIKFLIFWLVPICFYFNYLFFNNDLLWVIYLSVTFWVFVAPLSLYKKIFFYEFITPFYGFVINFGLLISTLYLYHNNKLLLLISLIIVWLSDIFAYIFGKKFGRKKLAPSISPGKTIEGAFGALFSNFVFIFFIYFYYNFSVISLMVLVLLLTPLSIMGDLFESQLKRKANIKDSGTILPGHGGILDRIDGLCSTIPIVAILSIYGFNL